ncbi:MAG TPA: ATP-binding protein [Verrucomicrobiae bacterium]
MNDPEIQKAYAEYDRQGSIQNSKFGCLLAIALMPAGSVSMDYFMYRDRMWDFFQLRGASALLTGLVLWLLFTKRGQNHHRVLSMAWYWIPLFFIGCMIYQAADPISPYYAGFNLVLLAAGLVLPWKYRQIMATVVFILAIYLSIYFLSGSERDPHFLANNLFFLGSTGVIVGTGSFIHSRLRFREFILRYELEQNRKTIEENNRKLVELDQAKSRFFANISHELRTPLTLLLAPLETLLNRYRSRLDGDAVALVHTMHSNGMRLLKLINDLLDIVRLESGKLEVKREALDLPDFLKGLASAGRQMAEDKRIRLETIVAPEIGAVMADRDKLEKTLLNLIFNALKFTPAGGRIDIRAAREGDQLVLTVTDTGMGIAANNIANVFSRFWQADDSARRKYQGVGIGLSLVKEFTELQGGTVAVDSTEGKGTTFTIRLPYLDATSAPKSESALESAPEPAAVPVTGTTVASQEWLANLYRRAELFPAMTAVRDAVKPVETSLNSHLPKILIADDEPDMLRFMKSQLKDHYQVIEAVDGQQAIDKAAQFLPDLVLTDMMMPEKDGLQVCRELRAGSTTQSIPVVLITARADEETKLAALEVGANDFLPKPFSTTELHVRVKNLVDSYDYQRRVAKQNRLLEQTIEQLQETEIQLVQTEKLASLGRLSAGIIHEINNPLNFAATGLFTLKKKGRLLAAEEQADYNDILRDVEEGLARVKNIVSDLRSFSHQDSEQLDDVSVADAIASTLRFLSHEWKGKVHIETNIPRSAHVRANKNKLIQVLINLLQNAIDATSKKAQPNGRATVWLSAEETPRQILLRVRDNGSGIPAENLDKIFDPFFTTKDVGQGMGLGLSICYRIIQQAGGKITVKSEPGAFAEFTLEMPASAKATTTHPEVLHATAV